MLILSITVSCFGTVVSAYEYISTNGWTKKSAFGSEFIVSEAYGRKCISVNSVGNLSVYDKTLDAPITADGNKYELSCKVYIPHIYTGPARTDADKQTFVLEGRTNNGNIPVLYGIRIDNGVISYYDGTDSDSISTAYNGNEELRISEGEWHTFKTVMERSTAAGGSTEKCRYYVDGMPLMKNREGNLEVVEVSCYTEAQLKAVNKLSINSRNVSDGADNRIYVSDIFVRRGYKETFEDFEGDNVMGNWNRVSGTGSIAVESTDSAHGKSVCISSSGKTTTFCKTLNQAAAVDNDLYSLSYDVYLPEIQKPEESKRQSVEVLGFRSSNTVNAYYGPKITNRQVYYYTGLGNYETTAVYSGSEKLVLDPGWHRVETVYDRAAETFSYYIDGEPLQTPKGDNLKAKVWDKAANYKIERIAIGMRNDYDEKTYIDNIRFRKLERTAVSSDVRVYNAYAKNASGEEISFDNILGEENLTVSFDYDASDNFTVIAAIYDVNENNEETGKQLKGIYTKRVDVTEQGYTCGDTIDVLCNGGNKLRLFAVDSVQDFFRYKYPLITREEVQGVIGAELHGADISNENFTITGDETSSVTVNNNTTSTLLKAPLMADNTDAAKKIRFDSTAGGPEEKYYINFTVNNQNYLKRRDGAVYAVTVRYFDEGYGCFTLEYNAADESFREAEYVELNNTNEFKEKTFYLKNAWFTGEDTDFRIATWGENMRYSNFDVIIARVTMSIEPYCDRDTATFTVKISDKSFYDYSKAQGSYTARLKYSLVDENGNTAVFLDENGNHVTEIAKNDIPITPLSTVTDTVSFKPIRYGLYYLKTEVTAEQFKVKSENLTELSYVHSDKTTVNPDYGISFQNNIYTTAGAEELAKNAGIGMLRWVRAMKTVEKVSGKDGNATVVEVADGNGIKYSSGNASHEWRTLEAMAANKGYTFLNNLSAGGMIYSDALVNGYKKQIPYGEIGKNLFADYCRFFAKNVFAKNVPKESGESRYYEIWNEFDSGAGTTFNMNGESKEKYGDLLVKAADAIYEKDSDAEIVAMSARFINTNQLAIDRVKSLIAGGNRPLKDYFKNASIHPYHWNDNPMDIKPTEGRLIQKLEDKRKIKEDDVLTIYDHMEVLKKVYNDNGLGGTKLWITELSWSPHFISKFYLDDDENNALKPIEEYKPITEKQQGSYLVQSYVMAKKNNITEKFLSYLFARQTTVRVDRDKNCGIIKYYKDTGNNVPYAATSAYLAIANMNMFMAGRTYADDFMFASGTAAAHKHIKENSLDLAILWSTKEEGENVSINLGASSVTKYDEYGNAETLTSNNGIYSLTLTQSTVYLEGNFTSFAEVN